MEDLREIGQKVIDAIKKRKPADAGDLALGIGEIIEELRDEPDQLRDKLGHLEGLFRELAYGEKYELRADRTEVPENPIGALSGVMWGPTNTLPIVASGSISPPPPSQFPTTQQKRDNALAAQYGNQVVPPTPSLPPNEYPPYYKPEDVHFEDDDDYDDPELEPEPKPFKKRWWNTQS